MKKTLLFTGFILLFCLPVHAFIDIKPVFGFNGFFSSPGGIPLWIFLENNGPGFDGRLIIVQETQVFGGGTPVTYAEKCSLRKGEKKQYYFTISLSEGFEPLRIELIEDGAVREQTILEIPYRQEIAPFLLDLTTRSTLPAELTIGDAAVRTVAPAGGLLPRHWSGYASVSGIVMDVRSYAGLSPAVQQGILHYVAAGGTLLFIPGPPVRLSAAQNDPIIAALFPAASFSIDSQIPSSITRAVGAGTVHRLSGYDSVDFSRFASGRAALHAADYESFEHSLLNSAGVRPMFLLPHTTELVFIFVFCFCLLCAASLLSRINGNRTSRILVFIILLAAAAGSAFGTYLAAGKQLYSGHLVQFRINQIMVPDSSLSCIVSDIMLLSSQSLQTGVDAPPEAVFRTAETLPEASIGRSGTSLRFALEPWRIGRVRVEYPESFGLKIDEQSDSGGRSKDTTPGYTLHVQNATGRSFRACEIVTARGANPMTSIPPTGSSLITADTQPVLRSHPLRRLEAIVLSNVRAHIRGEIEENGGIFLIGIMDMNLPMDPALTTLSMMRPSLIEQHVTVLIYNLSSLSREEDEVES